MGGFTDMMLNDGFSDPQEYMDYLENIAEDQMQAELDDYERDRDEFEFEEEEE